MLEYLKGVKIPQYVTFTHKATPSMRKKGNPYLDAVKVQKVYGLINFVYSDRVDHKPSERVWGTRLPDCPVIEHKGEHYLEVLVNQYLEVYYLHNGEELPPKFIEPFLKTKAEEPSVWPKDFKIKDIVEIEVDGKCFTAT